MKLYGSPQCTDLNADRKVGEFWERKFCLLAAKHGRSFTPHQIGRGKSAQAFSYSESKFHPMTLPDITIWTAPGEHHEVKHKDTTSSGHFGLELYRLDALVWFWRETGQSVYYTIHDYGKQQGVNRADRKHNELNDPRHWVSCEVQELKKTVAYTYIGKSWVNGEPREVPICYWREDTFTPLLSIWNYERKDEAA